jgi:hypothetical protein
LHALSRNPGKAYSRPELVELCGTLVDAHTDAAMQKPKGRYHADDATSYNDDI